jgi:ornithine cyclodeaminase
MTDIKSATIWARDPEKTESAAQRLSQRLKIPVKACESVASATENADIIVTTTPSGKPILNLSDIRAGQHITAMGSDADHKNEIDPAIIENGVSYFCDRLSQCRLLGELHHAIECGRIDSSSSFPELGGVISRQATGRQDENEITLCDLTGTGIQDTAIATLAYQQCLRHKAGTTFVT